MSNNPFYNYSGNFVAGMLARAEAEAAEFTAVQAGFNGLTQQGVDSGIANSYVITIADGAGIVGMYQDGDTVQFKPANANSGAGGSLISVNGLGAVNLKRGNGTTLQPADLQVGVWYTAIYSSTFNTFFLSSPGTVSVTSTGAVTGAPPVNKVGLVASGGVSLSVVPIDATYAIDQAIAPVWTGLHTFQAGISVMGSIIDNSGNLTVGGTANFNGPANFTQAVAMAQTLAVTGAASFAGANVTGPVAINVTGGIALSVNGANGVYAASIASGTSAGSELGLRVLAGANASDVAFNITNRAANQLFMVVYGDGGAAFNGGVSHGAGALDLSSSGGLYFGALALNGTTFQRGSFTATFTGCSANPTAPMSYVISGNICTVTCTAGTTGTSNATSFTFTGLPVACQPVTNAQFVHVADFEDNGVSFLGGAAVFSVSSTTVTLYLAETTLTTNRVEYSSTGWTSSGQKGFGGVWSATYSLI